MRIHEKRGQLHWRPIGAQWAFCCALLTATVLTTTPANAQEPLRVLWETSDPPMTTSAHQGPISFEFVLPGDVPEVWFHPVEHTLGHDTPERWTRTATHSDGGHLTSIFEATFDELKVVHNVVDWAPSGEPYWNSGSVAPGGFAVMQHDGNFVIYDAGGSPMWSTRSGGNPGARLEIQRDCNVVVRAPGGDPIWASDQPITFHGSFIMQ